MYFEKTILTNILSCCGVFNSHGGGDVARRRSDDAVGFPSMFKMKENKR